MMAGFAKTIASLDPRLKLGTALAFGPALWMLHPASTLVCGLLLLLLVVSLSSIHPLGRDVIRSIIIFVGLWVVVKCSLDSMTGQPLQLIVWNGAVLALRLLSLLLLGLTLTMCASSRALGLAIAWVVRPILGKERAWQIALSLSLMIHFLPLCLFTMREVRQTFSRRCPKSGLVNKMKIIPQATLRHLGQRTWNQTVAVAGRGLDSGDAWLPDFSWRSHDTRGLLCILLIAVVLGFVQTIIP